MTPLIDEAELDPARLDRDYNARHTVTPAGFQAEMARYRAASDRARAAWARHLDVVYDQASGQTLDIFGPADAKGCPVFIYFHGGYWRALSKRDSAMMADTLARRGIATVVVDYDLAPRVTLDEIVRQVRAATAFIWQNGADFGLDPQHISIGGSSAGGHLTGAVLSSGWHDDFGLPTDLIRFAMPVSGLFELAPLARTFPQEWLALDQPAIERLSPMRHVPQQGCPISVVWAERDAPGFRRQSEAYAALWQANGGQASLLEIPDRDHFDILMDWTNPDSTLSRLLIEGIESTRR